MDSYTDLSSPLWDLSQASSFSQLPDDDFLALLQKQFPTNPSPYSMGYGVDTAAGVNPQSISHYSLPSLSPPSDDSSPSPPQDQHNDDHGLKRKASGDDLEEGPSKAQHTSGSNSRKGASARRKSSGTAGGADDARLLKRKEQNRAAQRAFRERKEKHVKDLEDKVAALEAKNDQASSENDNLRDMLTRLQNENSLLKEKQSQQFTFSVPKESPASSSPSNSSPVPASANALDWSSLTAFDPAMLNLLDDATPQQTATDGAMKMNFGFGQKSTTPGSSSSTLNQALNSFTTIASNPMFTSFAAAFEPVPPHINMGPSTSSPASASTAAPSTAATSPFNFDLPPSISAWSTPNPDNSFDDLFGGIMGTSTIDFNEFNVLMQPSTISPVVHSATLTGGHSPANSTTSSTSSRSLDPLFNTPRESNSDSDFDSDLPAHTTDRCPRTREELSSRIDKAGPSMFAATRTEGVAVSAALRKADAGIMCEGSAFPTTEASDQNLEILDAWRTVTSSPQFRDSDIADLCSEFSAKARCDGTKVVLEPSGVRTIIESLTQKHHRSNGVAK